MGGRDEADLEVGDTGTWTNVEEVAVPEGVPQPKLWRVLILPVQPRTMSKGGIVLPAQARETEGYMNYIGKVVAMGPLAGKKPEFAEIHRPALNWLTRGVFGWRYTWDVKVGDWVVYGRYTGQRMEYRGVKFFIINDDEILGVAAGPEGFRMYV